MARLAGAMYLLTMATALFAEGFVRQSLLVGDSAAKTARNLTESMPLYRAALVADLVTFGGVVVLVWALYQLLRPVDRRLALLAVFFRLVEGGVHMSAVAFGVVAASLLAGGEYTKAFDAPQLQGLVGLLLRAQASGLNIGFVPLGIGSAVFAWLLWRSGYVPKPIAAWGIFASLLLAGYALALVARPGMVDYFYLGMLPMFVYEVGLGLWLLTKGVAVRPAAPA